MFLRIKIIATFLVIFSYFMPLIDIKNVIAILMIVTIGVLHGACDITLINQKTNNINNSKKIIFIIFYLLIAFFAFLVVYNLPIIGFIGFLLISSYHFGEQHLHETILDSKFRFFHFITYGLLIFMLMIYNNKSFVVKVLNEILEININNLPFDIFLFSSLFLTFLFWSIDYKKLKSSIIKEILYLLLLFLLFYTSNLIVSFAVYFVLWHSIPSILDQINFLYNEISTKSILLYLKNSGSYWIVSILGLLFLFYYQNLIGEDFYKIIYSFSAAVTIPHIFLINNILSSHHK
ncbi:MAG: hypothetical protein CBC76_03375 [Flavobacteriaceae bacterium TMED116]|nr:MAG: hypothetical protein CBC76_03375 [Flavobacteriaceae bacterium TMED116]